MNVKDELKKAAKRKIILFVGIPALNLFAFIFFFLVLIALLAGIIGFIVSFEPSLDSQSEFTEISEGSNEDLKKVISEITEDNPQAQVNGALIASTILVLRENKPDYGIPENLEDFDENSYTSMEPFSRKELEKLAYGMLATRVTLICTEENPPTGSTATTRTYTYVEELIGYEGNEVKNCESGFEETSRTEDLTYSLDYYKTIFLPGYIAEKLGLSLENDKSRIDNIILEIVEEYDVYQNTVFENGEKIENLVGLNFYNTTPIIIGDQALPLNLGIAPLGTVMPGPNGDFGPRIHPTTYEPEIHVGIDLSCNGKNIPIYSMYPGTVTNASYAGTYGNRVTVESTVGDKKLTLLYAHLLNDNVIVGQELRAGDQLGLCGETGRSKGKHLHFEMRLTTNNYETCPGIIKWSSCFLDPAPTLKSLYDLYIRNGSGGIEIEVQ